MTTPTKREINRAATFATQAHQALVTSLGQNESQAAQSISRARLLLDMAANRLEVPGEMMKREQEALDHIIHDIAHHQPSALQIARTEDSELQEFGIDPKRLTA